MNKTVYQALSQDLKELESIMRQMQLWQADAPSAEALASEEPFAVDTMSFDQWLQWLFIPAMITLIEERGHLPRSSDIAPMADYWCQLNGIKSQALTLVIKTIDERLTRHAQGQHQQ